jgi:hypothetical protein
MIDDAATFVGAIAITNISVGDFTIITAGVIIIITLRKNVFAYSLCQDF